MEHLDRPVEERSPRPPGAFPHWESLGVIMKICSLCKIEKSFVDFSPRAERPGKYRSRCKECSRAVARVCLEKTKSADELKELRRLRALVTEGKTVGGGRAERYRARQRARVDVTVPSTKHCTGCNAPKTPDQFSPNRSCRDGLNAFCKACMAGRRRESRRADPEKSREQGRKAARANRPACAERNRRYEAQKLRAEPKWSDRAGMRRVYEAAANLSSSTGMTYHVDHIVPLNSDLVCGLHCLANLQILPDRENIKKSNRHWPGMPQ